MAITLNSQADTANSGVQNGSITLSVTAGNLLVLCYVIRSGFVTLSTVTDSQSLTWTAVTTGQTPGTGYAHQYYVYNGGYTGSLTITCTCTAGSDTHLLNVSEWSGTPTSGVLNAFDTGSNTATTTHYHANTGVNATIGQLMIGVTAQYATVSDESYTNFTALGLATAGNNRQWWGYRIAAGTESATRGQWTQTSGDSAGILALYNVGSADASAALSGSAGTGGSGTAAPGIEIGL